MATTNNSHGLPGQKRMVRTYTMVFLGYIGIVVIFAFLVGHYQKQKQMAEIDRQLHTAASALKFMLADDFHDRAVDADSISFEEELKNRRAISQYASQSGFVYAYTLVEKNGAFYFAAPTVTEEEAKERERWYFYPYKDVPEEFVRAWRTGEATYATYSDQWGTFRSVALPQTSAGGRRYLACVDMDISSIKKLLYREAALGGGIALLLIFSSFPLLLLYRRSHAMYVGVLKHTNAELSKSNKQLAILDAAKSSLLNKVSHELRTPLTSIMGFVKLSEREFRRHFAPLAMGKPELEAKQKRIDNNLNTVWAESDRLRRLINDLLDLSKIESGKMEWHDERISPVTVTEAALASVSGELEKKQEVELTLETEGDLPHIFAESDKIHQVLINLLNNALKFTNRGMIRVQISRHAGYVCWDVRDSGIGIQPEDLGKVFDEFHSSPHNDTLPDPR